MKIAFSGTHGTTKTTCVYDAAKKFKIEYPTYTVGILVENASFSPYKINKETSLESQLWIFTDQISKELLYTSKYDILITDRTCVDAIAYTCVANLTPLSISMFELAKQYIKSYDKIYFNSIKNNDYLVNDGVRDGQDRLFRQQVEDKLLELYYELIDLNILNDEQFVIK